MVLKASCNFFSYAVLADPFVSEILKTGYTELVPYPTNPALTARHGKIAAPRDKPWKEAESEIAFQKSCSYNFSWVINGMRSQIILCYHCKMYAYSIKRIGKFCKYFY